MHIKEIVDLCNTNEGLLLFVYVVATFGILLSGRRANKIAQSNIKVLMELEQERSRPFVDVEMVAEAPYVSLRVTNRGLTPAYDVKISISPPLKFLLDSTHPAGTKSEDEIGLLKHGVGSLAPSANITALIGDFAEVKEANPQLQYSGTVAFRNYNNRIYESPVSLDLRYMENSCSIRRKTIHDIATHIEELQNTFHLFVTGFHKPFVITQDAKEKKEEDAKSREQFKAKLTDKKNETGTV